MRVFRIHSPNDLSCGVYLGSLDGKKEIALSYKYGHEPDSDNRPSPRYDKIVAPLTATSQLRINKLVGRSLVDEEAYFAFKSIDQLKDWFDEDDCLDIIINGDIISELEVSDAYLVHLSKQTVLFLPCCDIKKHVTVVRTIPFEDVYDTLVGIAA
jgi:hypothetical protein